MWYGGLNPELWAAIAQGAMPFIGQSPADKKIQGNEHPTEEERIEHCNIEAAKIRYSIPKCEDWVYAEIPDNIVRNSKSRGAWLPPTPKPVEEVMGVITYCWQTIQQLGCMPQNKVPTGMTDDQIESALNALNIALLVEYTPWGKGAGYEGPPQFSSSLPIESKRTIIAMIQTAIHESGIKEVL